MINFDNTYLNLPDTFYAKVSPEKVTRPSLLEFNSEFASRELGLNLGNFNERELADLFSGQTLPDSACSIALAYAGHQFGHFVPQLGDGRAILLGEIVTPRGRRYDIQFKGSGRTPFSRNGDGKSSLGPVIREYIVSEAMHFLGVPTTRALAATLTGDTVYRDQPLPGGVFTRVASSHIRIGTFEYFAARSDRKSLKLLVHYSIDRHYPDIKDEKNVYISFLQKIAHSHACLVAHWMSFGFIHGVMNTDNMSISGETLDYGPCAFVDNFAFDRVFSSIDQTGRYSYNNQISIAKWNLYKLASCLIPLIHDDKEQAVNIIEDSINSYSSVYEEKWIEVMRKKLGLFSPQAGDQSLINNWLRYLEEEDLDFTLSFRKLSESPTGLKETARLKDFLSSRQKRLENQPQDIHESEALMNSVNPVFIPRNHQVERAIQSAYEGDLSVFTDMNHLLKKPFIDQPEYKAYAVAPKPDERIKATFCGT
ncbi:MAG: protein adenylyltransferase SelO [Candidatus Anammoxibacter sp.]